jgi:energy-coupling factor transporter ATP-binding protein EcfA2
LISVSLGFQSLQINADQSNTTLVVTIDGNAHKLYEVGAGVAQLIIVLATALIHNPPYIFIDEPELSLHPSLQLNFLATLASFATKGLFFSTHSIGLARSTAQRISLIRKTPRGSTMEPFGSKSIHFSEVLGELSYSGRSELGCDGLLIVEGVTDVLVFQEFLRKIHKDQKYVVMPLSGASLINGEFAVHLSEISRIVETSKIHIFIDSERVTADAAMAKERQNFLKICTQNGVHAVASNRRATENYFDDRAIRLTLGGEFAAIGHFELLNKAKRPWGKADNWKIARAMDFEEIKSTDLGEFLISLP